MIHLMMAKAWLSEKAGTEGSAEETGQKGNPLQSREKGDSHKETG